jgi:hypothetical protein
MTRLMMISLTALALGAGACGKEPPCDLLAKRLCDADPKHCVEARAWLDEQGAGEADARDAACKVVLEDPQALSAYVSRFVTAMAPAPKAPTPAAPKASGTTTDPTRKPTTKDQIREVGETIEELGTAGEKAGEAIDKLEDAFKRDSK